VFQNLYLANTFLNYYGNILIINFCIKLKKRVRLAKKRPLSAARISTGHKLS